MLEPRARDTAIGGFGRGEFAHHFGFRAGMAEDVDKVNDHDAQRCERHGAHSGKEALGGDRVVEFGVSEGFLTA